jgi:methionyl-tRNA synthetase
MAGKFYITTAIPYVNAPPHIGFALELVQADVIARRQRLMGKDVFFLTGTDEHGLKNYQTALSLGKTPEDFVKENSSLFLKLVSDLGISNTEFIRTSDKEKHWPSAQKLWNSIDNSGDIYKKNYKGLYCAGHETFHTPEDLINDECPSYPGKKLSIIEEENYFFRLSKYKDEIQKIITDDIIKIFPASRKNEILAFLEKGLEDISFSRQSSKLPWGIPVPGDETQVMYVWCDALSNYLSGVDYSSAGITFQKFWPPDLHIVGKDILRFHAIIWPAMLLSARLPLPKAILVHGFVTSGGQKMSKSLGNVVDPFEMINKYGRDAIRYFLIREIPTTEDGDFTESKLIERYNGDLANGLGNLVSRIFSIGAKYGRDFSLGTEDLEIETKKTWEEYEKSFLEYQLHDALASVWKLIGKIDEYLNKKEPWKLLKGHDNDFSESMGDEISQILSSASICLANIAWMLKPFIPDSAETILKYLGLDEDSTLPWKGRKIELYKIDPIFPRIK